MRGLDGRTAVVTGGSTIIGRAVVRELHEHGMGVAIADVDAERGEPLARELGERVLFRRTDITDDAQLQALVAEAAERFGGIDALVNLACSYVDEGFASPRADWLASFDVNVANFKNGIARNNRTSGSERSTIQANGICIASCCKADRETSPAT